MESLLQQTHKIMMKPTRINKAKYALEIVMKYFSENVNTSKKSTVVIRPFAHSLFSSLDLSLTLYINIIKYNAYQ